MDACADEIRDAMSQRVGLSGSRARDDQQGIIREGRGGALLIVELVQPGSIHAIGSGDSRSSPAVRVGVLTRFDQK
jgi:hypothetical protein